MRIHNDSSDLVPAIQPTLPTVNSKINITNLSPAKSEIDFEIHNHALEWSLAEPIVMDSADDIKSKVNWQDFLEPFHHQVKNLMTFCRKLPVTLIADDVGLGKTISAGLILSELMIRNRVSRALVICPSILGPQWIEELESKFGIQGRWAIGKDLDTELRGIYPVVATTYQTASTRLEHLKPGAFDMLILDEAHKVRNLYGAQSKPKFAKNIRQALSDRLFRYVVMLTATPIQNRLWDLYSLIDCLAVAKGHENPFGNENAFYRKFITDSKSSARKLNPNRAEEFRGILRQYLVRTRRQDVQLLFPDRKVKLFRVEQNSLDRSLQALVASNIDGVNGLLKSSILVAMMSSPQALATQLENMAVNNTRWKQLADEVKDIIKTAEYPSKLNGLLNIIDQLRKRNPKEWRLVIFTTRKETQKLIASVLDNKEISYGLIRGGAPDANLKTVRAYTDSPPTINVIVSTDAGSEGVNLQAGNVIVNYDLPWNPMIVEQRIGRVQRLASHHASVIIFNLAVNGSPEEKIVSRLIEKLLTVSHTVGDVEAILEAAGGEDSASSFEQTIRDLVLKSLKGQNVERATHLITKDIEDAKELFESQRANLDSKLGNLNELHDSGPAMPRLESITPSVSYQDFVQSALKAEGYEFSTDRDGVLNASKSGAPTQKIVFSNKEWQKYSQPGLFHGRSPRLYLPGKPDFERLVQRWLDRGQHCTKDLTELTQSLVTEMAKQWLLKIENAILESVVIVNVKEYWQGQTTLKITATNAVDSYETLTTIEHNPEDHVDIVEGKFGNEPLTPGTLRADSHTPTMNKDCIEAYEAHSGIVEFNKFYSRRLDEELGKAGRDPDLVKKIQNDLNPSIHGETVSQQGYLYEECDFKIHFSIDGFAGYSLIISSCPVTNQVFSEPEVDSYCEESGQKVPADCLGRCDRSEKYVLKHLLIASDESGRKALSAYTRICELTGMIVLDDEQLTSVVSGKSGLASSFQFSPISNRPALPDEFMDCSFTGNAVLPDEIETSEVSGQPFRSDQKLSSVISGISGHESEFVKCTVSGDVLLMSEAVLSDVSGVYAREDHSVTSERSPHRRGTVQEQATCERTGIHLLTDEVERCSVTNQLVDETLLERSDQSQQLALPSELVKCEITNEKLLPSEIATSVVSGRRVRSDLLVPSEISGKLALPEECLQCEITDAIVLPDELTTSDISDKRFRIDQSVVSVSSGRIAHITETVVCESSGRHVLRDETGISEMSGKRVDKSLLVPSEFTGKLALSNELECCEFTERRGLPDELIISEVSGLRFSKKDSVTSEISDRVGHLSEVTECQFSHKKVLKDEVLESAVSGLIIAKHFALQSPVSKEWALDSEFALCEITGDAVFPSELVTSDESERRFRKDQLVKSPKTDRVCHTSESYECESTGALFPITETDLSEFSGKRVETDLLVASEKTGRKGMIHETFVCHETQKRLLMDELGHSTVSGELVDQELLKQSEKSGKLALGRELVKCSISHLRLLPSETVFCGDIQAFADRELTAKSDVSGLFFLIKNLKTCSLTGKQGLASELVKCELSGTYVIPEKTARCAVTGKIVRIDKLVRSDVSGRFLLPKESRKSFKSGQVLCPEEAVFCHWNEGYLTEEESGICKRTGLTFSAQGLSPTTQELVVFTKLQNNKNVESLHRLISKVKFQADGKLKSVESLYGRKSKYGNYYAVRGTIRKMLGMVSKTVFFMIAMSPEPKVIGRVTIESTRPPGWQDL